MLTQAEIKYIRSLHSGHVAKKEGKFVAEGLRMVQELLRAGFLPERLYTCSEAQNEHEILQNAIQIGRQEMERITNLETASTVLAVFPRVYATMLPLTRAAPSSSKVYKILAIWELLSALQRGLA